MGYDGRAGFEAALLEELRAVESHYAVLFEKTPDLSGPGNLVFTGAEDDPETLETLARLGFREPGRVAERIRIWHHGRYSSTRSARARELLTELIPTVLETLSTTNDPDAALLRFDDFLRTLPAGVHILSLFTNNPALLGLLAKIMGSAPRLADWLSRHPIMLEGVLQPAALDFNAGSDRLTADLEEALDEVYYFEEKLDICRYWNNAHVFEIGVQMLNGRIDGADAGRPLADLATACVRALLPATAREFVRRHGVVPDSAFAVLGFGKLGGRELTTESDLDLLFLYETRDEHAESDGSRPLPCQTYYARLCQRFIAAMSAPTNEGKLYEVDMRLRPAGASGPIATSLAAFTRYQNEDAWTWEHLALTRARVIAAPEAFAARIENTIASALTRERDPDRLVCAVADMRERMERELAVDDFWSIKRFRGGMIDIEFIAQYLQLRHANRHPEVLSTDTTDALERLAAAGCLEPSVADDLVEAMTLWRRLQGIVRLAFGAGVAGRHETPALQEFVARALGEDGLRGARGEKPRPRGALACAFRRTHRPAGGGAGGPGLYRGRKGTLMAPDIGQRAPDFEMATDGGGHRLARRPRRQEGRPLLLSQGRHTGVHQGGMRFPRFPSGFLRPRCRRRRGLQGTASPSTTSSRRSTICRSRWPRMATAVCARATAPGSRSRCTGASSWESNAPPS